MLVEQEKELEQIKARISFKYSIIENMRKEMRIKARALYEIEQDIKRLEEQKKCITTDN